MMRFDMGLLKFLSVNSDFNQLPIKTPSPEKGAAAREMAGRGLIKRLDPSLHPPRGRESHHPPLFSNLMAYTVNKILFLSVLI